MLRSITGVVDQHVDGPDRFFDFGDSRRNSVCVGDVQQDALRAGQLLSHNLETSWSNFMGGEANIHIVATSTKSDVLQSVVIGNLVANDSISVHCLRDSPYLP